MSSHSNSNLFRKSQRRSMPQSTVAYLRFKRLERNTWMTRSMRVAKATAYVTWLRQVAECAWPMSKLTAVERSVSLARATARRTTADAEFVCQEVALPRRTISPRIPWSAVQHHRTCTRRPTDARNDCWAPSEHSARSWSESVNGCSVCSGGACTRATHYRPSCTRVAAATL